MRFSSPFMCAIAACLAFSASGAYAESEYVSLSAGVFDIDDQAETAHFGLEYRGMPFYHGLLPIAGVAANVDGGLYGYAGLNWDITVHPNWIVTPTFAVAAYEEGSSRDLGGVLEFRSGIELDYRFENQHRVGLAVHHLSNAGIYDRNPGTETVMVTYSVPVNVLK